MNLAAANPGRGVGDDPADWVVNFGFCFFQCFQLRLLLFLHPVAAIFLFC